MKRSFPFVAVLLLCLLAAAQAPVWKEYEYPDKGFAISAPAQPTEEQDSTQTAAGQMTSQEYTIELGNDSGVMLGYTDLGDRQFDPRRALEGARDGSVKSVNGRLSSEKDITLDGNPGIEFEVLAEKYHALCRYYIVKNKLFTLMTIFPNGRDFSRDAIRVLDSFRLLKPKK